MQKRREMKNYPKPKTFDYNVIVIGTGSAGLVSSYIAAAAKARVALLVKHKMLSCARRAEEFGFRNTETQFDFAEVMERVQKLVVTLAEYILWRAIWHVPPKLPFPSNILAKAGSLRPESAHQIKVFPHIFSYLDRSCPAPFHFFNYIVKLNEYCPQLNINV